MVSSSSSTTMVAPAAVQPTLTQFATTMHFEPLDRPNRQKFKILQIQSTAGFLTI